VLEVADLEVDDDRGLPAVRGLSLQVRGGEIVGVAGVDGNGQSELVEAITGLRAARGPIRVAGRTSPARECAARSRRSGTSPRTATAAASCSTSRWRRTSRCASTGAAASRFGLLSPKRMASGAAAAGAVRRARRPPETRPARSRAATSRRS
jgi:ABC-type sugar transport system ATPase subunit